MTCRQPHPNTLSAIELRWACCPMRSTLPTTSLFVDLLQAPILFLDAMQPCTALLWTWLPEWRRAAVSSRNWNSAFRLSACGLQLGVAQLGLVRAAEGLPRGALPLELGGSRELAELWQVVLEQVGLASADEVVKLVVGR